MDPDPDTNLADDNPRGARPRAPLWCVAVVAASALLGLVLIVDQAFELSATYDEVTYLQVAARWWRTGDQVSISRMGSPLTFWKVQQAPTLWALDHLGYARWVDDPITHQAKLLPVIRLGGCWVWLVALGLVSHWAGRLYGPRAMAMASALFALSPNLLAHGVLATMELPLVACSMAMLVSFWTFLKTSRPRYFWSSAILGGLAFSCKFTTVLIPPILAIAWSIDLWRGRWGELGSIVRTVAPRMLGYLVVMAVSNLVITGFATIPLSPRGGVHPLLTENLPKGLDQWAGRLVERSYPQDWVGFATQVIHQHNGGPSYLLGERRSTGWSHYYLVTLAVKVPLAFWMLVVARLWLKLPGDPSVRHRARGWMPLLVIVVFLLVAMSGSKRNYGVRYLLPIAGPAIVWVSGLAEGRRWSMVVSALGVAGMSLSVAIIHPHELSYFNAIAGGPIGGRRVLSDSNLDWGQGARSLGRLQRERPEFQDLTLFYFGDTDPAYYGVVGRRIIFDANRVPADLPADLSADTAFLAVSASLQWGPWGPTGYFQRLDGVAPVAYTADKTIAIYRTSDLTTTKVRTGRDRE